MRGFLSVFAFICFAMAVENKTDAACLAATREIELPDGSVKMKTYACSLAGDTKPSLQVEFNRLSEMFTGQLVHNLSDPQVMNYYSSWLMLTNSTFIEAKRLFDTYGYSSDFGSGESALVVTYSSALGDSKTVQDLGTKDRAWSLSTITGNDLTLGPSESKIVAESSGRGWNFIYSDCGSQLALDCVKAWRPFTRLDLRNFRSSPGSYELLRKYLGLVDQITGGNPPADFLTIETDLGCPPGCGVGVSSASSSLLVRKVMLHTVFVKNISDTPVTVDGLVDAPEALTALRPYLEEKPDGDVEVHHITPITLSPGQTLIIPKRLSLLPPELNIASSLKVYNLIHASTSEYVNRPCADGVNFRRESFKPPSNPSRRVYSYGPAIVLRGISVSGEPLLFDRPLANFIEISAEQVAGSCPYVSSYDDHDHEWVRHGKIIDNASAPEKETTGRVRQDGLVTRFKLSEEEPEVTFVHKVRLELALADGRAITLRPRNRLRAESAGHYDKIKYGAEREYDFDLPVDVGPMNVLKSTLWVTGYYLRYSQAASMDDERK
jgi:hypothetical protein